MRKFTLLLGLLVAALTASADTQTYDVDETTTLNSELELLIATAEAMSNAETGTTVGYCTAESIEALKAAIVTAKAVDDATEDDITALQTAIDGVETVLPEAGKFYYITSACSDDINCLGMNIYVNDNGMLSFAATNDINHVFQFVPDEEEPTKFYLYNVGRGSYLESAWGSVGIQLNASTTRKFEFAAVTIANIGRANVVSITLEDEAIEKDVVLYAQASDASIRNIEGTSNTSPAAWTINEVSDMTAFSHTLTVGEMGYATICLGYTVTIPEGVKCFTIEGIEDGELELTQLDNVLHDNVPVIVKAEPGTYEFVYSDTWVVNPGNMLCGSTFNEVITDANYTYYVLGKVDGVIGLFPDPFTNGEFVLSPYEAYLPIMNPTGADKYVLEYDDSMTGVENVEADGNGAVEYFDLSGRRVAQPARGFFIVRQGNTIKKAIR